jgi:polar amino acid transport system substrate-binding protein
MKSYNSPPAEQFHSMQGAVVAKRGYLFRCILMSAIAFLCLSFFFMPVGHAGPQKKLIVGVVHDPPYLIKKDDGQWGGISLDIWKAIALDMKVDYELREMPFNEILNALEKNQIDLSIDTFFVLAERELRMDYSTIQGYARLGVATVPGKISHPWWLAVKTLFSWGNIKILGVLFFSLFLFGIILWLIERRVNPDHFGGNKVKGIGSGIYWVGSTLTSGVCIGVTLKSMAARTLGLAWMFLCAVAFSALIASLTNAIYENRNNAGLVTDEQLRLMHLGGVKGSAESIVLPKLGGRYKLYTEEQDALNGVLKGEVDGFLYDMVTLHYYQGIDYKDKIYVHQTGFRKFFFGFELPRNSPITKQLNVSLLRLMEKPDWAYMLKRYGLQENFESIQLPAHLKSPAGKR